MQRTFRRESWFMYILPNPAENLCMRNFAELELISYIMKGVHTERSTFTWLSLRLTLHDHTLLFNLCPLLSCHYPIQQTLYCKYTCSDVFTCSRKYLLDFLNDYLNTFALPPTCVKAFSFVFSDEAWQCIVIITSWLKLASFPTKTLLLLFISSFIIILPSSFSSSS